MKEPLATASPTGKEDTDSEGDPEDKVVKAALPVNLRSEVAKVETDRILEECENDKKMPSTTAATAGSSAALNKEFAVALAAVQPEEEQEICSYVYAKPQPST